MEVANVELDAHGEVVEWRIVAGFDNYEVSNTGLVRNRETGRILRAMPRSVTDRQLCVTLYREHRQITQNVHQVVATAFLGDSSGRVVDHIDRNPTNNHVSNLRYTTSGNNRNKTSFKGAIYEHVDELPDGAIVVEHHGDHHFENLHYCDSTFYLFNDPQYRILVELTPSN